MQDVFDRVKVAEDRAKEATERLAQHEKESSTLYTRIAVLESRYSDLKQTLDGVVRTQGAQGQDIATLIAEMKATRDDVRLITNRVWAGSAAGAGGTGLIALILYYLGTAAGIT